MSKLAPRVPFQPEPLEKLKARFAIVLKHVINLEAPTRKPTAMREHVFDFEDGIRIVVALENARNKTLLHFSVGVEDGVCQLSAKGFENVAQVRPMELAGQQLNVFDRWVDDRSYHLACDPP